MIPPELPLRSFMMIKWNELYNFMRMKKIFIDNKGGKCFSFGFYLKFCITSSSIFPDFSINTEALNVINHLTNFLLFGASFTIQFASKSRSGNARDDDNSEYKLLSIRVNVCWLWCNNQKLTADRRAEQEHLMQHKIWNARKLSAYKSCRV